MKLAFVLAMIAAALPIAARADGGQPTISIKAVDGFRASLRQMGYEPELTKDGDGHPILTITSNGTNTAVVLGGCEDGSNCKYVAFVTGLSDVINPPADWIQKVNDNFDLIKVCLNDDKTLRITHAAVVEGLPVSSFRYVLDQWFSGVSEVSQKAIDDKLVLVAPGKKR